MAKAAAQSALTFKLYELSGELYSLAKRFWPIFEGVWAGFREGEGSIFSNHQQAYAELHALSPL